jgi:CubicO group peptidase (beta-lactamase class C family)
VGSRGGNRESEIGGESEIEREMLSEKERIRSTVGQRRRSRFGYGSSTGGWRCDFWWPEPTSGETGTVQQFLWSGVGPDRI